MATLQLVDETNLKLFSHSPPANTVELVNGSSIQIDGIESPDLVMNNDNSGNLNLNHGLIASSSIAANLDMTAGRNINAIGQILQNGNTLIAVGTVVLKAGGDTNGWLACNGGQVLKTSYPALFSAIGSNYGTATGLYFNVPSLDNYGTNNSHGSVGFFIKY